MLIIGVVLTAAALLTLAALVPVFRAARPPRWTRSRWLGETITLTIVGGFTLGIAAIVAGAWRAWQSGPTILELGAVALTVAGAIVLLRGLSGRWRPAAPATPTLVASATPEEPQPPRPARPTRRAA